MAQKRRRRRRAARGPADRPERQQDPRLVATQVALDGEGVRKGDWMVAVSPVDLDDGRRLMWHPPQPVAFNLLEAKRHRDAGVKQRRKIMGNLIARPGEDELQPPNTRAALDCLSDLVAAVLFAFTAVESLANHVIDMLPDDTIVDLGKDREIPKSDLVRLGIDEKLKRVVPLLDQCEAVAGTAAWEGHRRLKFLRDELLHVKERGYEPDSTIRTAYDRLMVGEGDCCVEDAMAVVLGAFPGFLPENVLEALK